jgi:hypothetical protein
MGLAAALTQNAASAGLHAGRRVTLRQIAIEMDRSDALCRLGRERVGDFFALQPDVGNRDAFPKRGAG